MQYSDLFSGIREIMTRHGLESYDLVDSIADYICDGKGTARKAPDLGRLRGTGYTNAIPSSHTGPCARELIVCCFDRDNLGERFREMIYHSGIYCLGRNQKVLFITSKWDPSAYNIHAKAIKVLRDNGIEFIFVQVSEFGAVELPVL